MLFALIHELGHLFIGVLLGFKAETLKIMPLGFCIEFTLDVEDYNKKIKKSNIFAFKKILIALAGPLVNFIIIIVGLIYNIESNIIYSNLLIMLFNLIPIYPLDGGKLMKIVFSEIFYFKFSLFLSFLISCILIGILLALSIVFCYIILAKL